jgi:hypothetical protein
MSARWLIVLFVLLRPLAGDVSGPSFGTTPRTGIAADRPAPRTRGPPDQLGAPRPADGCSSDLVRTITAQSQYRFHGTPVGRASHPDRDP